MARPCYCCCCCYCWPEQTEPELGLDLVNMPNYYLTVGTIVVDAHTYTTLNGLKIEQHHSPSGTFLLAAERLSKPLRKTEMARLELTISTAERLHFVIGHQGRDAQILCLSAPLFIYLYIYLFGRFGLSDLGCLLLVANGNQSVTYIISLAKKTTRDGNSSSCERYYRLYSSIVFSLHCRLYSS